MINDPWKEWELSEPGSGVLVLPKPDPAATNGWRRFTPPYADPVQVGVDWDQYNAVRTGVEI